MIANPTPITAATFAGMWITNLGIFLPTSEKPRGFLAGNLLPYDGTHLLAIGGVRVNVMDLASKRTTDTMLDGVLTNLTNECKRQASNTSEVKFVNVSAHDSTKPVFAQIGFTDGNFHRIPDCFALAETDSVFSGVLMATMAEVARQAGLAVS